MDNKQFKFTSNKQFEYLYTTMEENLHIARGDALTSPGQEDLKNFWENLAEILNKIGPLNRNASGWQKIWNEHRCFILKKIQKNPSAEEERREKLIVLTDLEKGVAQIVNPVNYSNLVPPPKSLSAETDEIAPSPPVTQENGPQYRIKVKASSENFIPEKLPPKIPQSAKDTILKIQEETHKYLQRMTKIEEERLRIEKKELEEKVKFREELAVLVNKVKTDISMSINM